MTERLPLTHHPLVHPLSLGRLIARAGSGNYKVHGSKESVGCVVVPAFGQRQEGDRKVPGESNQALARLTRQLFPGVPVIAQWEVDDALREQNDGAGAPYRIEEHAKPGAYLDTREVVRQAAEMITTGGLDGHVGVLAHPHHMPRADASMGAVLFDGRSTVAVPGVEVPWDEQSSQRQTRSPKDWGTREAVAIGMYAARGWIDLSHAA
ncbi:MAG TPA: hypothetical protein VMY99_03060 [Nevskiaceae bacterium]|nr:hypothetical protein [Nevskiaceae bacterium]